MGYIISAKVKFIDWIRVTIKVLIINLPPNLIKPIIKMGKFSTNIDKPKGMLYKWFKTVDIPVRPPGEISFGETKTVTADAKMKHPIKNHNKSFKKLIVFLKIFNHSSISFKIIMSHHRLI